MQIVHSPKYAINFGVHVFPTTKYARVLDHLRTAGLCGRLSVIEPSPAEWHTLGLVHDQLLAAELERVVEDPVLLTAIAL